MRKYIHIALIWALLLCLPLSAWEVEQECEATILRNDRQEITDVKKEPVIPLVGNGVWVRKTFDLNALGQGKLSAFQSVSLRLFCMMADQSVAVKKITRNGFTEKLALRVNGNEMTLDTGDPRLPHSRKWIDIEFPISWLKSDDGKAVVEMHKMPSSTNDDYFYIGVDTATDEGCSVVSVDNGKVFRKESKFLAGLKGEYRMRLAFRAYPQEQTMDFSRQDDIRQLKLSGGIVAKDGMLSMDGVSNRLEERNPAVMMRVAKAGTQAEVLQSAGMNITESGFAFAAVIRQRSGKAKSNDNAIVACKPGCWFIGRTGNAFNLSFCVNDKSGVNWNRAVVEGSFPETGQWAHIAFSFERINEVAQGNVGYYVNIYCNGELQARKFFQYAIPIANTEPVLLGNGTLEEYGFCGDIASAAMFKRTLSEAEIAKMAANAPLVKALPDGQYELAPKLQTALETAIAKAPSRHQAWLLQCLQRAARTGFEDHEEIIRLCQAELFQKQISIDDMAKVWNKKQRHFLVLTNDGNALCIVQGRQRSVSPVLGFFNGIRQEEMTGIRPVGWTLRHGENTVRSHAAELFLSVSAPSKDGAAYKFNAVWEKADSFKCTSSFSFTGQRLEMSLNVENLDSRRLLENITFPQFSIAKLPGKNEQLVFPLFSGVLYKAPSTSLGISGNYPTARSAMQFIGYFDERKNGIYAAYEGTDGALRTHSVNGRNGTLRYEWSNHVPYAHGAKGGNSWQSPGVAVLQSYTGDWFEAGQIYKQFLMQKADWFVKELPRKDTPKWYRDNAFWLAASSGTNPLHLYLRDYFEFPYAIWWCRWEKVSDEHSPLLMALPGNAQNAMLRDRGIFVHGYVNGRLWGFDEGKNTNVRKDEAGAQAGGVMQKNGKVYLERYGIPYVVMCPGCKEWRDILVKNAQLANSVNINGVYFDQLPCGSPQLCYNSKHGHPIADPTAWSRGYRETLREIRRLMPNMALDGEDNSEIYAADLDGFMTWRFTEPNHVPLFQSIYGGGRCQFTARAFDAFGPGTGSFEASNAKLGEQFVCGEQIGWMHIFDSRFGTPRRLYAKKLAHWRLALLDYLNQSDMLRPLDFSKPIPEMRTIWGNTNGQYVTTPCIRNGVWRRISDGRILLLFTNTTEDEMTASPIISHLPGRYLTIFAENGRGPVTLDLQNEKKDVELRLAGLSSQVWLLTKERPNDIQAIFDAAKRISTYKDCGESLPISKPDFSKQNSLKANPGTWIRARQASWMLFAFSEGHPTLGHDPSSKDPDLAGNWILARKGAVISFGEIDFGDTAPDTFQAILGAGIENAGAKVSLWDVTGATGPNTLLAQWDVPQTGKWFDFKTLETKALAKITGKRLVIMRVENKDCNIRGWRVK